MTTETTIIKPGGTTQTSTQADGAVPQPQADMPGAVLFILGLFVGALGLSLIQAWARRRVKAALQTAQSNRPANDDVAAMKQRIETLEAIVTDKPRRLADAIDGLAPVKLPAN
jgi:hypothetical protein